LRLRKTNMLTSLRIDDDLYRMAKASAASQGLTITKYLDQALRLQLVVGASGAAQKQANAALPISLPTCPVALKGRDLSVDDLSAAEALLDAQEAVRFTDVAQRGSPNG
jgi:hypothetical protein